jgi:hypothetical protein
LAIFISVSLFSFQLKLKRGISRQINILGGPREIHSIRSLLDGLTLPTSIPVGKREGIEFITG